MRRTSGTVLGRIGFVAAGVIAFAGLAHAGGQGQGRNRVFTVGNYPVEARDKNAVAAKEKAHADGQQAALQSLFKRIVPVTSYPSLERLRNLRASDILDGVAVRSERNSPTQYIANLDFTFQAEPVRETLKREGIRSSMSRRNRRFSSPSSSRTASMRLHRVCGRRFGVPRSRQRADAAQGAGVEARDRTGSHQGGRAQGEGMDRVFASEYKSPQVVLAIAEADTRQRSSTSLSLGRTPSAR